MVLGGRSRGAFGRPRGASFRVLQIRGILHAPDQGHSGLSRSESSWALVIRVVLGPRDQGHFGVSRSGPFWVLQTKGISEARAQADFGPLRSGASWALELMLLLPSRSRAAFGARHAAPNSRPPESPKARCRPRFKCTAAWLSPRLISGARFAPLCAGSIWLGPAFRARLKWQQAPGQSLRKSLGQAGWSGRQSIVAAARGP